MRPTNTPIAVHTPLGAVLHSTHEADLAIPGLPPSARHGHVLPNLATQPLLSIGQLCDAGCDVTFTASNITISHNNTVILHGTRSPASKLWELDIQHPAEAHAAIGSASPADLVAFAHVALFSLALFSNHLAAALTSTAALGFFAAFIGVPMQTTIQAETPEAMRGKVFGLQNNAVNIALSLPLALAGVAESIWGLSAVLNALALLVLIGGLLSWTISRKGVLTSTSTNVTKR